MRKTAIATLFAAATLLAGCGGDSAAQVAQGDVTAEAASLPLRITVHVELDRGISYLSFLEDTYGAGIQERYKEMYPDEQRLLGKGGRFLECVPFSDDLDDIRDGSPIVLRDASGSVLQASDLIAARLRLGAYTGCSLFANFNDVPEVDTYIIDVAGRQFTYAATDLTWDDGVRDSSRWAEPRVRIEASESAALVSGGCKILPGAKCAGADLTDANLAGVDLSGADLSGASLVRANLIGANLSGADLTGADLVGAKVVKANLRNADLTGAELFGVDFRTATVAGADFTAAAMCTAKLPGDGPNTSSERC